MFILFLCTIVSAEEVVEFDESNWPITTETVVNDIIHRMTDKEKETVKSTKCEDLIQFHHSWGMSIRNYYGLWRGNHQLILSACGQPCYPDDASMKIIESVWLKLQKQTIHPSLDTR